jgi:hypothetical protein
MKKILVIISCISIFSSSCSKEEEDPTTDTTTPATSTGPNLIFKLYFDSTLARLDNFGNPATIPAGNSAQSPRFNKMSTHYIEFAPDSLTALGSGEIVYKGAETTSGGSNAVDFDQAVTKEQGDVFYSIPLSQINTGTYKWLRVSLTYQNYDIDFKAAGNIYSGTLASFVGFNTYITNYDINTQNVVVNSNKIQGYWGFETSVLGSFYVSEGQSPGTTVPNPISVTSPIPAGSCVVTGNFPTPLVVTGNETQDIIVNINLSTNNSFEWKDLNSDGIFEPSDGVNPGDTVVDMGLRGLFPTFQ